MWAEPSVEGRGTVIFGANLQCEDADDLRDPVNLLERVQQQVFAEAEQVIAEDSERKRSARD